MNPDELLPQVYGELRKLAAAKLASEKPGQTLDATALVHEAFLKLGGERSFATQSDYLKAAAQAMRRILVDRARARNAAICDTGGLIGICCIPKFLGGKGDIVALLDHLDYAIKKFGAEHVAIGTDVAYTSRNDKAEREKIGKRSDGRALSVSGPRWEHLWPPFEFRESSEATQSIAWTNWPLFTIGLVQRGHSDEVIRKVLGENMLRVWRANQTVLKA